MQISCRFDIKLLLNIIVDLKADMGKRVTEIHYLLAGGTGVSRESRWYTRASHSSVKLSFPREGASEPHKN